MISSLVTAVLELYVFVLFARVIMGYAVAFGYRPRGVAAAIFDGVYAVTDPVVRPLDRLIPPLRIGNAAISLGYIVLLLIIQFVLFPLAQLIPF